MATVAFLSVAGGSLEAASIGVNFTANEANGTLDPLDSAGVIGQSNWNNVGGQTGSVSSSLVDSGANGVTGFSFAFTSNVVVTSGGTPTDGEGKLKYGWIESPYAASQTNTFTNFESNRVSVTLSGVPYETFDVYFYVRNQPGVIYHSDNGNTLVKDGDTQAYTPSGSGYVEGATYVKFTGLSNDTSQYFVVSTPGNEGGSGLNSGIAGFQIVETSAAPVPEPTSPALIGAAAMTALISRRRRR